MSNFRLLQSLIMEKLHDSPNVRKITRKCLLRGKERKKSKQVLQIKECFLFVSKSSKSCLCIYGDLLFGQFNQYFSQHEDLLLLLWHLSILVLYTIQRFSQLWAFSLLHCTSICYSNEILLNSWLGGVYCKYSDQEQNNLTVNIPVLKKVDVQSLKVSANKPSEIQVKTKSRNETKHGIFAYCVLCKIVLSELWISEISHFFCSLYLLSRLFLYRKTVQTLYSRFFLNFFCCHTHSKEMRLVLTWWWKFAQLICSKTRKERLRKQIKRRKNSEALALLCRFCLVITNANFNGHKTANYTDYQSLDVCFFEKK